jgi:hypothetical protein
VIAPGREHELHPYVVGRDKLVDLLKCLAARDPDCDFYRTRRHFSGAFAPLGITGAAFRIAEDTTGSFKKTGT